MTQDAPILAVRDLRLSVRTDEGTAQILDFVDFSLSRGEVLGIVGESGCGKSTLVRAILGLPPKNAVIESGEIIFRGENLLALLPRQVLPRLLPENP